MTHWRKPRGYVKGERPIYLRITMDGVMKEMSIHRNCDPGRWDSRTNRAIEDTHSPPLSNTPRSQAAGAIRPLFQRNGPGASKTHVFRSFRVPLRASFTSRGSAVRTRQLPQNAPIRRGFFILACSCRLPDLGFWLSNTCRWGNDQSLSRRKFARGSCNRGC
jgi:hypothetical protein